MKSFDLIEMYYGCSVDDAVSRILLDIDSYNPESGDDQRADVQRSTILMLSFEITLLALSCANTCV